MEWIFLLNLVFHPLPAATVLCIDNMCEDERELIADCEYLFNIVECPELIGV